jgi:hypothetical protein
MGGAAGGGTADPEELKRMRAQLAETEQLMAMTSQTWEDKLKESHRVCLLPGSFLAVFS